MRYNQREKAWNEFFCYLCKIHKGILKQETTFEVPAIKEVLSPLAKRHFAKG